MKMHADQPCSIFCLSGRRLAILLLTWLSLFAGINTIPVESHEAFVLQAAREMDASGNWTVPHFNQEPRLTKPPLNYWLTLGISRLDPFSADIEPWHGRFWPVFAGLLILLLTAYTGEKLYGGQAGFLAALLLLGTKGVADFSHNARPDFLYAVLCALQLFAWIGAWQAKDSSAGQSWKAALGWVLAGLATLSKGPQVPAVFLLGFLLFLLCGKERRRVLKVLRPFSGLAVWLVLCLPWWLLLQHRLKVMGVDIGETQLSGSLLQKLAGWKELFSFYYILNLLGFLLPFSLIIPWLIFWSRRRFEKPGAASQPLLYVIAVMLTVFTIGGHYRPHYMLPLLPLLILLLAAAIDKVAVEHSIYRKLWRSLFAAGITALAVCAALLVWQRQYAAVLLLAGAGIALILLVRKELREPVWRARPLSAQLLAAALMSAWLFSGFNALPLRNVERNRESTFALSVGQAVNAGDLLVAWGEFPDILPYYARHQVVPVNGSDELKNLFVQKNAEQNVYVIVPLKQIPALAGVFEFSVMKTGQNGHKADKALGLVAIQSIRQ
jgi:4-amino-4-deoxy-L-arabinose transferase-like glycosyltransferase